MKSSSSKPKPGETYSWLYEKRDSQGRNPDDPDYDDKTLYIPPEAWDSFSPFERQFWEIKEDTVMFFKKGKFYELYQNDAELGNKHFQLKLTKRGHSQMAGVPEGSFEDWACKFLSLGYRVARVGQVESSTGKAMRERNEAKTTNPEKTLRRELLCILTAGTLTNPTLISSDMNTYCMSIKEVLSEDGIPSYGICILEASKAEISLCTILNDSYLTNLATILAQRKPKEIIVEKNRISRRSLLAIKNNSEDTEIVSRIPEYWGAEDTLTELEYGDYFTKIPECLTNASDISLTAFGGLLCYLRELKMDKCIMKAATIEQYSLTKKSTLVLDGTSLKNLNIFTNGDNDEGTLYKSLNKCITPFGKRLLQNNIYHPLVSIDSINQRLDAVEEVSQNVALRGTIYDGLIKAPDLERIAANIYSGKTNLKLFLLFVKTLLEIFESFKDIAHTEFNSECLKSLFWEFANSSSFDRLKTFRDSFSQEKALNEDVVEFNPGYSNQLDSINTVINNLDRDLENYRVAQSTRIGCKITYRNVGKEWFQMDVPKGVKVPPDWSIRSDSASTSRYWDSKIEEFNIKYKEALEIKEEAIQNAEKELYDRFSEYKAEWNNIIRVLANIDFIHCLALNKLSYGEYCCRPTFIESEEAILQLEDARSVYFYSNLFVPNSISLGGNSPKTKIITGPNMGGKSTLLRTLAGIVITAQLGSYIPASRCIMTPIDRIFTRIGASDNIISGKSTFMVELSETNTVLKETTNKSLVILDELGRGTGTFDGTHYHMISNAFKKNIFIEHLYMDYILNNDDKVVFMYKLRPGICPKSYGMNVAKMAGIPNEIIEKSTTLSKNFEYLHAQCMNENSHRTMFLYYLLDIKMLLDQNPMGAPKDQIINAIKAYSCTKTE